MFYLSVTNNSCWPFDSCWRLQDESRVDPEGEDIVEVVDYTRYQSKAQDD